MKLILSLLLFAGLSAAIAAPEGYMVCESDGTISNAIVANSGFTLPGKTLVRAAIFPTAKIGDKIVSGVLTPGTPAPAALRDALRNFFQTLPDDYKVQFMGLAAQIDFAFDNGQPVPIIKAIIQSVDPGDDLNVLSYKTQLLALPQWPANP